MAIELCLCRSAIRKVAKYVSIGLIRFHCLYFGIIKIALGPQDRTRTHVGFNLSAPVTTSPSPQDFYEVKMKTKIR